MSKSIESRVVEMQFDNSQFEKNVAESRKTLGDLNKDLSAFNQQSFDSLVSSIQNIESRFTAFGIAGAKIIGDLTGKIEQFIGKMGQLGKALTLDQVYAGWGKFGEKTSSVATIVGQGYDIDVVTKQLEKLNWFTDETSYNFTDMVNNIGKFTATGQDLDTSVNSMMGIANWAAKAGQNAGTASRAMYNLSQAMGMGALTLMDYRSIQNASMDTDEFREISLETAVALGKLTKQADGTYKTLNGHSFSKSQFTTYLSDRWYDTEVMTTVFQKYGAAVDQLYEYTEEHGGTASEAMDALGDSVDHFGLQAFKAAQQARTWADVIDSLKDAASTTWLNIFETIFGNADEATEFFTEWANNLYEVFVDPIWSIAEAFEGWRDLGGREAMIEGLRNAFEGFMNIVRLFGQAWQQVFPSLTSERLGEALANLSEKFKMATEAFKENSESYVAMKNLFAIFKGIASIVKVLKSIISIPFKALSKVLGSTNEVSKTFEDIIVGIANAITAFAESYGFNNFIEVAIDKLARFGSIAVEIAGYIGNLINGFREMGGLSSFIKAPFSTISTLFTDFVRNVLTGGMGTASGASGGIVRMIADLFGIEDTTYITNRINQVLYGIQIAVDNISKYADIIWSNLSSFFRKFFSFSETLDAYNEGDKGLSGIANVIMNKVCLAITTLADTLGDLLGVDLSGFIEGFQKVWGTVSRVVSKVANVLTNTLSAAWLNFFSSFQNAGGGIGGVAAGLIGAVQGVITELLWTFSELTGIDVEDIVEKVYNFFETLKEKATELLSSDTLNNIKDQVVSLFREFKEWFDKIDWSKVKETLGDIFSKGKDFTGKAANGIVNVLGTIWNVLKKVNIGKVIAVAAGLAVAVGIFAGVFKTLDLIKGAKGIAKKTGGILDTIKGTIGGVKDLMNDIGQAQKMKAIAEILKWFAAAIGVLALALVVLSGIQPGPLLLATGAIAILMSVMCGMIDSFSKINAKGVAKTVAILGTIIGTLITLTASLKVLSAIKPIPLLSAIGAIAASIGLLIGAVYLMGKINIGAIAKFTAAMLAFSAAAFSIAAVAAGIGIAAAGIGLLIKAIASLADIGTNGLANLVTALTTVIVTIITSIPAMVQAIGMGIVLLIQTIGNSASTIVEAVKKIVIAILDMIDESLPRIAQTVKNIFAAIIDLGIELIPKLIDLIIDLLAAIRERIPDFVQAGVDILLAFMQGISDAAVKLMDGAYKIIIDMINAMAKSVEENTPELIKAVNNLIATIIVAALEVLFGGVDLFIEVGKRLMGEDGFFAGLKSKFDIIKNGISNFLKEAKETVTNKISEWKQIGTDLINGLKEGITNAAQNVVQAAKDVANKAVSGVKKFLGIHSPSKVFAEIGKYSDEGFAKGLTNYSRVVGDASEEVGYEAISSMQEAIAMAADCVNYGDASPTIRPVIDLSEIQNGVSSLDSMLAGRRLNVSSTANIGLGNGNLVSQLLGNISSLSDRTDSAPSIVMNINGAEGQNVNELADIVIDRLTNELNRRKVVYA